MHLYHDKGEEKVEKLAYNFRNDLTKMEAWFKEKGINIEGGNKYLSGHSEPNMTDLLAFPPFERIMMLENTCFHHIHEKINFKEVAPTVYAYTKNLREHPVLK
jgi:hypothetical protein